jgi:RNA polymerase sigma-70 factor (ECF subfamily)
VEKWCRRSGLQATDVEDIEQDVFETVFRKIADFQRDETTGSFRGWLRAITGSKIADFFRRRPSDQVCEGGSSALRRLGQLAHENGVPDNEAEAGDDHRLLYERALELIQREFKETSWRAFWRVAVDKQRPGDVAMELGVTINAVYLATNRVRSRLRKEFGELLDKRPSRTTATEKSAH